LWSIRDRNSKFDGSERSLYFGWHVRDDYNFLCHKMNSLLLLLVYTLVASKDNKIFKFAHAVKNLKNR
jgi:hypothetical protein